MTPPTSRTWSRRGDTPVIRVRGRSRRRLSVAALTCYKPGERPRLIYRPAPDRRADGRKSFDWRDYRDLLIAAHTQLGGPLIVLRDNLNTHLARGMREFIDTHDWLTVYQLPAYSPDLNPVEGIWSLLRRKLANTAFLDPEHLVNAVRRGLREIQHRPHLINGVLAETGLTLNPDTVTTSRFQAQ
jgi:transposase